MDLGLFAALSDWIDPGYWWAVFQVVLGLGAVIFVHELGHFLAAKSCGVKCEKFYVGFDAFDIKIGDRVIIPRKLLSFTKGETEYGIGILPLGGRLFDPHDFLAGSDAGFIRRSVGNDGKDSQTICFGFQFNTKTDKIPLDVREHLFQLSGRKQSRVGVEGRDRTA